MQSSQNVGMASVRSSCTHLHVKRYSVLVFTDAGLVQVWGEADTQSQLDGVARNQSVYERVASNLADIYYERNWQRCKTETNI